jgi:adenylate kinase
MIYPFEKQKITNLTIMNFLLGEYYPRAVVIGGPGKGKSTVGQQLAQIHRAKLIGKEDYQFEKPKTIRIPFRIVLKYFAQWLAKKPNLDTLEAYIAERMGILTSRPGLVSPKDIQDILCCRPCLLILDGLDEVGVPELQEKMLARIKNFLSMAEKLNSNLMVVASSRPKEFDKHYKSYFTTKRFLHLELIDMSAQKVNEYAKKWVLAKKLKDEEEQRIISTLEECQQDNNTSALLTSPLYVTIILLIIKNRGRPPSQKEDLFNKYWEIIFAREKSKDKGIIQSDESLLFGLHSYLGHLLHERAAEENIQSRLSENDFRNAVCKFLRQENKRSSSETINLKMEALVKDGDRLVLITEANDLFGFDIRSFQEFFAAVYLIENAEDTAQRFESLKNIIYSAHWRNVALFFVGRIARTHKGEANKILRLCKEIDQTTKNHYLRPGSWFALEVASDGAFSKINPDLQYDFIEYGLKVLDTGLTTYQKEVLKSLIEQLSQEDKQELLYPLLEDKLRSLPDSCLETVLELYAQHFRVTKTFQDKIDALLISQRETTVITALYLAMSYKSKPSWIVERLQAYWNPCKKIFYKYNFSSYGTKFLLHSPEYTESLLRIWSVSEDQVKYLAEIFFKNVYYYYPDLNQEVTWDLLKPNTYSEQLILLLRCSRLLAYLRRINNQRKEIILIESDQKISQPEISITMRVVGITPLKSTTTELIDKLEDLLKSDNLIPRLEISLWSLLWLFKEPQSEDIFAFIQRFKSICSSSILDEIWLDFPLMGNWPILNLAVEKQLIKGQDSINKLLPFLEAKKQIEVFEEIERAITKYVQQLDNIQNIKKLILSIHTQIGLDELLPQLVPLVNQMGITVGDLVKAYIVNFNEIKEFKYDCEEIYPIIASAENEITQNKRLKNLLFCLIEVEWPSDPIFLKKAQHLLQLIISNKLKSSDYTFASLSVAYFLKLLTYNLQIETIIPLLHEALPQDEILFNKEVGFISHVLHNYFMKSVDILETLLNHKNKDIRIGSLLILYLIQGTSNKYKYYQTINREDFIDASVDVDYIWDSIKSDDKKISLLGKLNLIFFNYPIENINSRQKLLSALQQNQNAEKEETLVEILEEIIMPSEKHEIWLNLLEEILGKPWNYSNAVLCVAMERYQQITNN